MLSPHIPLFTEPGSLSVLADSALSIQTQPIGSLSAPRQSSLLDQSPLCDIEDGYASDIADPCQPSDIHNLSSINVLLQDEDSRDSSLSLSNLSSSSLSPRSKKVVKIIVASICKDSQAGGKAADYLASANEQKDSVIAALKHKNKSQEGKTAAQTKKVNLAIQGETKALEESAASKAEADRERKLREKEAAEKSTLLIAHAGLSIAAGNHSTGDKVSFFQFNGSLNSDCEQIPPD